MPASASASAEAAIAIGTARETCWMSFAAMCAVGSKPLSSPAIVAGSPSGSKSEMRPTPLRPRASARANASRPFPLGERHPIPVTATRRRATAGFYAAFPGTLSKETLERLGGRVRQKRSSEGRRLTLTPAS